MKSRIVVIAVVSAVALGGCAGTSTVAGEPPATAPASSAQTPPSPSPSPTKEPSRSEEPTPGPTSATADVVLTAKNSKPFAAALAVADNCDESLLGFATTYEGRTIQFDGSVAAMANHDSYTTRYDIGIAPGDRGSSSSKGPLFKYEDVNMLDLHFPEADTPATVGVDDTFVFVAQVDRFDPDTCLFFLDPVSTHVR